MHTFAAGNAASPQTAPTRAKAASKPRLYAHRPACSHRRKREDPGALKKERTQERLSHAPQARPQYAHLSLQTPAPLLLCLRCSHRGIHEERELALRPCCLSQTFLCRDEASNTVLEVVEYLHSAVGLTWPCAKGAHAAAPASKQG